MYLVSKTIYLLQRLMNDLKYILKHVKWEFFVCKHRSIEPAASNMVKTNIVLDAEIRDTYKITVIATDQGTPQMTGTSTIRINVLDINDNQPSFPPNGPIKISECKLLINIYLGKA